MKYLKRVLVSVVLLVSFLSCAQASDWDVAGKVLTGIEGLRILTGGNVDIVGAITGIKRNEDRYSTHKKHHRYVSRRNHSCERAWIPHYAWKKKWIPEHTEYDEEFGEVIVEGHYVRRKVKTGGHWQYARTCKKHRHHAYNYSPSPY